MPAAAIALACLAGSLALSWLLLPPKLIVVSTILAGPMLAIAWFDWREYRIPDILSLPSIPAGLLASGALVDSAMPWVDPGHAIGSLAGGAAFFLVRELYYRFRGHDGLGLGDIKLAAAAGAWTGWQGVSNVVLFAALATLAAILVSRAAATLAGAQPQKLEPQQVIPFGVTLAPAIWIVWLLQQLDMLA